MPELDPSTLPIEQAFDVGMKNTTDTPDNGSKDATSKSDPAKPDNDGGEVKDQPQNQPAPDADQGKKPEGNDVDPSKPYTGEYTKERFDGLMSAWQKDRQAALSVGELQTKIQTLEQQLAGKVSAPQNNDNIELPPELQNADEDTQNGFKLIMKSISKNLVSEQRIKEILNETLTAPLRQETEIVTRVQREVQDLTGEFGMDFANNQKAVREFAVENDYPLGTLKQAYLAWRQINAIKNGKKTVDEIEATKRKDAGIPNSGANRSDVLPVFDPERDGNKTSDDIWDEARKHI